MRSKVDRVGSTLMSAEIVESATNLRYQCLQVMLRMQRDGGSLSRLLPQAQDVVAASEQAQLQAWCFGWCRWAHEIAALVDQLLDKPLKAKDMDVYLLMQLGVFQLRHTPTASHAAVDETVKVVKRLKKPWARGLINAVLRNYQRQLDTLESGLSIDKALSHPVWLLDRLRTDWPSQWEAICHANNVQAPMSLRVNQQRGDTRAYQQRLKDQAMVASTLEQVPDALVLDSPAPVTRLPGFGDGDVSVQDAAAQIAARLLREHVAAGGRLLDACAAPGGKTAHAAESGHFSDITALDSDKLRLSSVSDTLHRINAHDTVSVKHADAALLEAWWDGQFFDAVLLDAPCSGTGVIRRHPDIKLLRRDSDITSLVETQRQLLDVLWRTIDVQGVLLYATCSVLKDENERQVNAFLKRTENASLLAPMMEILPGDNTMDGFFYAVLGKIA